jgi:hypothetical protein
LARLAASWIVIEGIGQGRISDWLLLAGLGVG